MRICCYLIIFLLITGCSQNQHLEAAQIKQQDQQSKVDKVMIHDINKVETKPSIQQEEQTKRTHPALLCSSKPNCVSTQELRTDYQIKPFYLVSDKISIDEIEQIALTLKRTKTIKKTSTTLLIEAASLIFHFVDDMNIVKEGDELHVRSKSRTGYSDFGVNKKHTEELRQKLITANIIKP